MNSGMRGTQSCLWSSSGGHRLPGDSRPFVWFLHLSVDPFAERIFEADKYRAGQENVTSVSGLGDDAYYAQLGPMTILNVKKGSIAFKVTLVGTTDRQTAMDAEMTIASQVLLGVR